MKAFRILPAITLACLSTISIADDDAKVDAAKLAASDTCLKEAQERYSSATAISDVRRHNKAGMRGYYIDLKVGNSRKKVRCIALDNGEVMITKK